MRYSPSVRQSILSLEKEPILEILPQDYSPRWIIDPLRGIVTSHDLRRLDRVTHALPRRPVAADRLLDRQLPSPAVMAGFAVRVGVLVVSERTGVGARAR